MVHIFHVRSLWISLNVVLENGRIEIFKDFFSVVISSGGLTSVGRGFLEIANT